MCSFQSTKSGKVLEDHQKNLMLVFQKFIFLDEFSISTLPWFWCNTRSTEAIRGKPNYKTSTTSFLTKATNWLSYHREQENMGKWTFLILAWVCVICAIWTSPYFPYQKTWKYSIVQVQKSSFFFREMDYFAKCSFWRRFCHAL